MNSGTSRWRRLAIRLLQHAAWVVPGAQSPWAEAMRRELDYIGGDTAALRWALGGLLACYRVKLAALLHRPLRAPSRSVVAGGVLMLFIAVALQGRASGQTEPPQHRFDETACSLPDVSPDVRARLRCGTVNVPRDYANPAAGQFKLAVVVIKSEQQPALPEPVVYISGGPGNPLTIYAAYQARIPYAPRRDLILVDQRGTGRSKPRLCPDLNGKLLDAGLAIASVGDENATAGRRAAYLACRNEAIGRGIDLKDFGTRNSAEDFEWVRQALGVKRWNLYGESYGTTIAMTLVALHPEAVRSVVLDSIYPPDPVPLWSTAISDARDAFFAHCAQDKVCAASFPDLAGTYRDTLAKLAQDPLPVSMPRSHEALRMTASAFEVLVGNLLYYPTAYSRLPRIIQSVHDGDTHGLGTVVASELAAAATEDRATHAAVECRDRPHFRTPLPDGADVLDRMQLNGVCEAWSELGPPPLVPQDTSVPTLILAGHFDPVTRPALSRHVVELIGNHARWIEFPLIGHNVRHFSPCGSKIADDFIDKPELAPDTSCVGQIPSIRFAARERVP